MWVRRKCAPRARCGLEARARVMWARREARTGCWTTTKIHDQEMPMRPPLNRRVRLHLTRLPLDRHGSFGELKGGAGESARPETARRWSEVARITQGWADARAGWRGRCPPSPCAHCGSCCRVRVACRGACTQGRARCTFPAWSMQVRARYSPRVEGLCTAMEAPGARPRVEVWRCNTVGGGDSRQVAGLGRVRAGQARRAQLRAAHKKAGFALLKPRRREARRRRRSLPTGSRSPRSPWCNHEGGVSLSLVSTTLTDARDRPDVEAGAARRAPDSPGWDVANVHPPRTAPTSSRRGSEPRA